MTLSLLLLCLVIIALLCISAFFSGSETAFTATNKAHIHKLQSEGNKRAALVEDIRSRSTEMLSAILIGNNLVNILASVLATSMFLRLFGDKGVAIATLVMTVLVVIFAEVMPKTYAINMPERFSLAVAPMLRIVMFVLRPIIWCVRHITQLIMKLFGIEQMKQYIGAHDEIRGTIDMHVAKGSVIQHESDMLGGILDLRDLQVSEVMVHRKNMQTINAELPMEEIIRQVLASPYTRIPLWRKDPDNIIGLLHVKNVLRAIAQNKELAEIGLEDIKSDAWFVPETTTLVEQLNSFRSERSHSALVVDEYGVLMGLLTLEDILEEIVGDISDEHDEANTGIQVYNRHCVMVDGVVTIRDLNRKMGWDLPDNKAASIAGLVINEARSIPEIGQIFMFYGFRFRIVARKRNQILRVHIQKQ